MSGNTRPNRPMVRPDGRCGATTKQTGKPCQRKAGAGTNHKGIGYCSNHGGSTPSQEKRAALFLATNELQVMGVPIPVHPIDAILQCVSIAAGEVQYATEQIQKLKEEDATGPEVSTRPLKLEKGAEDPTHRVEDHGPITIHIWIKVRHDAMDRLTHYSKVALAAGVAERQVKLAENQAQTIAKVIRGVVTRLEALFPGISHHPELPAIVRGELEKASAIEGRLAA